MKNIAVLILGLISSLTASGSTLNIVFDVLILEYSNFETKTFEKNLAIDVLYTLTLDTNDFIYEPAYPALFSLGTWSFGDKQHEVDSFRSSIPSNNYEAGINADGYWVTSGYTRTSIEEKQNDWTYVETGDQSTHRTRNEYFDYRYDDMDIGFEINSSPAPNNIESFITLLNSIKNENQEAFFHQQFGSISNIHECHEINGVRLNENCILTSSLSENYLYFGTARINSINFTTIPLPSCAWLMGSGLLGLTAAARRKKV